MSRRLEHRIIERGAVGYTLVKFVMRPHLKAMKSKLSGATDWPAPVFDESHYAATTARKMRRALELGPKYYFKDLLRYFAHRRTLRLPMWDWATLVNPIREFQSQRGVVNDLPSGYAEGLRRLDAAGIRLTIPRGRLEALIAVWWRTRGIPGDDIECGSYRGATALLLAWLGVHHGLDRRVHMLDTFAGMPTPSVFDAARVEGEFQPPADQAEAIRRQAEILGVAQRVEVHAGLFADTFTRLAPRRPRFAFVHIDANIYSGTLDACTFTLARTEPGGAIVFDDYNGVCDLGARLAIDQALNGTGLRPRPLTASSAWVRIRAEENGHVKFKCGRF
jgi:Macrocin-O-methyltransferase (TylF)